MASERSIQLSMQFLISSAKFKKLYSCGVFIDLSKAFDTVNHDILLDKLHNCGIKGILNKWFASYLKRRFQTNEIKNAYRKNRKHYAACHRGPSWALCSS